MFLPSPRPCSFLKALNTVDSALCDQLENLEVNAKAADGALGIAIVDHENGQRLFSVEGMRTRVNKQERRVDRRDGTWAR